MSAAMNKDERIHAARGERAGIVREQGIGGGALLPRQFAEKRRIDGTAGSSLITWCQADQKGFRWTDSGTANGLRSDWTGV